MPNAGRVTLFSFGLQLRLSFGSPRQKPAIRHDTTKEAQQLTMPNIGDDTAEVLQRPVVFGILGETSVPEIEKLHLNEVADIMKQYPDIRISIVGHTCNSETKTENKRLGASRAKAVARYLRGKGIDRSRMDVSYARERDPVSSYDANYLNRRVVITVE
jgi:outer membrane protein OmpA-like peptidoglycan-associated protein